MLVAVKLPPAAVLATEILAAVPPAPVPVAAPVCDVNVVTPTLDI